MKRAVIWSFVGIVIVGTVGAWLIWPNVAARTNYAFRSDDYEAAVTWVLANSRDPGPGEIVSIELPAGLASVSSSGLALRFRDDADFVYFIAGGETTMPDGILYSSDGSAPPSELVGDAGFDRIDGHWSHGGIAAGYLEAGSF